MGDSEIDSKVTHDFSSCTYIKNVSENIENLFKTTLDNY